MKVCIIHKGSFSASWVKKCLEGLPFSIEEILLESYDTLSSANVTDADIIIFDVSSNRGEVSDCSSVRMIAATIPILLVTSNGESSRYREKMIDAGVDGCIQVPFLKEELILRMEKLVNKKSTRLFFGTNIESGGVRMDLRDHLVVAEGENISLTKTEYSILLHLFLHKNRLVSSKELSFCLDEEAKETSLALNIHIFNLRKKIKDSHFIKTVPRYGFTISGSLTA